MSTEPQIDRLICECNVLGMIELKPYFTEDGFMLDRALEETEIGTGCGQCVKYCTWMDFIQKE